jgi:L-amino acid N-acyltransferase YncA
MHIRPATEADIPAIVAMSACFYETTSYRGFAPFDPDAAEALARHMIADGVMLVAGDEPVGMVGLMVVPFMFNPAHRVAYEVVWWVNPDAQGLGAGKALLQAIEPACRAKGCTAIQMVHLASSPPQAAALYERLGFAHTESSYTKELV